MVLMWSQYLAVANAIPAGAALGVRNGRVWAGPLEVVFDPRAAWVASVRSNSWHLSTWPDPEILRSLGWAGYVLTKVFGPNQALVKPDCCDLDFILSVPVNVDSILTKDRRKKRIDVKEADWCERMRSMWKKRIDVISLTKKGVEHFEILFELPSHIFCWLHGSSNSESDVIIIDQKTICR
jgi:hypothetical protein